MRPSNPFLGILLAAATLASAETLLLLPITGDAGKAEDMATMNQLYRDGVEGQFKGTVLPTPIQSEPCGSRDCALKAAQLVQADQVIYSTLSRLGTNWVFSSTIVKANGSDAFNQRLTALSIEDMEPVTQSMATAILNRRIAKEIAKVNSSIPNREAEANYGLIGKISNGGAGTAGSDGTAAGFHQHDGFYLSMNGGSSFGRINLDRKFAGQSYDKLAFSGAGPVFDFKIGWAVKENLILSFDEIVSPIADPKFERKLDRPLDVSDTVKISTSSSSIATDFTFGLGITYYFMPQNFFLSGTLGIGGIVLDGITFSDFPDSSFSKDSDPGFALNVKAGKEWWISKNWGLGVSAGFGYSVADEQPDPRYPDYKGTFSTNRYYILFNTTFN